MPIATAISAGALLLTALVASPSSVSAAAKSKSPIVIGTLGDDSGAYASYGLDALKAYQLAVAQMNAKGGILHRKVKLLPLDSQGDPAVAAQQAQKFVDQKVTGVLGDVLSSACLSAAPIFNRNVMPMVTPECSNPTLTQAGYKTVFRIIYMDNQAGTYAGTYAATKLHAKTAVVINDNSTYSQGTGTAFEAAFAAAGGQISSTEQVTEGQTDFTAVLSKVVSENPSLVFFSGFYTEGALLVKQAGLLGLNSIRFWGAANIDPSFFPSAGSAINGLLVETTPTPQQLPTAAAFVKAYKAKYHVAPGPFDDFAYDAANILMNAIKKAGSTNHSAIVKALHNERFAGSTGLITFKKNGDRPGVPFITEVYNASGALSVYTPS